MFGDRGRRSAGEASRGRTATAGRWPSPGPIGRMGALGRLVLLLGPLVLAACGGSSSPPSPVATNAVDLPKSYRFEPKAITVPAGATVTWTNHDNFTHTIHLFDDGGVIYTLKPGDSATFTFTTPGLHRYECSLHPRDMQGSVLVTGG
jgi:plastocyanin